MRAERREASSTRSQGPPPPEAANERHLPSCKCSQCLDAAATALEPSVSKTPSLDAHQKAQEVADRSELGSMLRDFDSLHTDKPQWNNDFTDICRGGFDVLMAEKRKKQLRLAKKKVQEAKRGAEVRSHSCEVLGEQEYEPALARVNSSSGLRPVVQPSKKADEGPCYRINFDKRTSRHMHAQSFMAAIAEFRAKSAAAAAPGSLQDGQDMRRVQFFARKRPLFDHERTRGEYDVITAAPGGRHATVHVCGMGPDLIRMRITHTKFPCSWAFGEDSNNDDLYRAALQPLVEHLGEGGMATCLMYGATGSGKTYTMTAMQERAAGAICTGGAVRLSMFEIAGKEVRDLLGPGGPAPVTLRENAEGDLDFGGATLHPCGQAEELLRLLTLGQQRRSTSSTLQNSVSSRSHLVSFLHAESGGSLVLVDLAGSERKEDSNRHTAERQKEGAFINASLLALKECIRAITEGSSHVPYRMSNLTRVLRESFTRSESRLHIVATVAPGCSDAEHSVATLRMASGLCDSETGGKISEVREDIKAAPQRPPLPLHSGPDKARKARRPSDGSIKTVAPTPPVAPKPKAAPRARSTSKPSPAAPAEPEMRSRSKGAVAQAAQPQRVPRPASASKAPTPEEGATPTNAPDSARHPNRWDYTEILAWMQSQRLPPVLPVGVDGKLVIRWNVKRWTEVLGGDERLGLKAFNGLRLEIDRLADEERNRRRQFMHGR